MIFGIIFPVLLYYTCRAYDFGARGRRFDRHSRRCVLSLSKTHLLSKNTGDTQEAVMPSQHDRKIYWEAKQKERNSVIIWLVVLCYSIIVGLVVPRVIPF